MLSLNRPFMMLKSQYDGLLITHHVHYSLEANSVRELWPSNPSLSPSWVSNYIHRDSHSRSASVASSTVDRQNSSPNSYTPSAFGTTSVNLYGGRRSTPKPGIQQVLSIFRASITPNALSISGSGSKRYRMLSFLASRRHILKTEDLINL